MLTRYTVPLPDGRRETFTRQVGSYLYAGVLSTPRGWRTVTLGWTRVGITRAARKLQLPIVIMPVWAEKGRHQ